MTELPWADTDDAIMDDIARRILDSATPDEVLTLQETTKFENLVGSWVQVEGFVMRPSDLDEGPGAYALISYTDLNTGEGGITSTGANGCVAQLARMWQLKAIPFTAKVTEVESSKKGHDNPLYFTRIVQSEPAEQPF